MNRIWIRAEVMDIEYTVLDQKLPRGEEKQGIEWLGPKVVRVGKMV